MTISEYFAQPINREEYQKWIKDPTTKAVLGMVGDITRPKGLTTPSGEAALYLHGMAVGYSVLLDALVNLEKLDPNSPEGRAAQADLESTYGADALLRKSGYDVPEK